MSNLTNAAVSRDFGAAGRMAFQATRGRVLFKCRPSIRLTGVASIATAPASLARSMHSLPFDSASASSERQAQSALSERTSLLTSIIPRLKPDSSRLLKPKQQSDLHQNCPSQQLPFPYTPHAPEALRLQRASKLLTKFRAQILTLDEMQGAQDGIWESKCGVSEVWCVQLHRRCHTHRDVEKLDVAFSEKDLTQLWRLVSVGFFCTCVGSRLAGRAMVAQKVGVVTASASKHECNFVF